MPKGIAYVEKTGNTNDEIMTAASSMVGQVDAVFTPTDNVVMAAAAAVSETLTKGGIPFYTGADSFVTAGAFATCGVNYTELGTYTADMALDILETGVVPNTTSWTAASSPSTPRPPPPWASTTAPSMIWPARSSRSPRRNKNSGPLGGAAFYMRWGEPGHHPKSRGRIWFSPLSIVDPLVEGDHYF